MVSSQNDNSNNFIQTAVGIGAGSVSGYAISRGAKAIKNPYLDKAAGILDDFSPEEQDAFFKEAERMIDESGIVKKGFRGIATSLTIPVSNLAHVKNYSPKGFSIITQRDIANIGKQIDKSSILNQIWAFIALIGMDVEKFCGYLYGQYNNAPKIEDSIKNGGFMEFANKIFSTKAGSLLHEVGHAVNANSNLLSKVPGKLALISSFFLIPLTAANAMFSKKPEKRQPDGKDQRSLIKKVRDFTHKHLALTITGLSMPLLLEEGLASFRATNFAKTSTLLGEATKQKHNKALMIAFTTYLISTASLTLAIKTAVTVKDTIVNWHPKKDDVS